ncbi:MAG: YccT family protein [Shewanella sp.]
MNYQSILCTTALILGVVQPATADVKLSLPKNAEVLMVNGKQAVKSDHLVLADGINQIAFRYAAQYRQQADSVHYLSDVLIVRFDASAQALTLTLPAINSATDAKKFDKAPKLTLLNAQAEAVSFSSDKLIKNGLQLGRDFEDEILQYNLSNHPASLNITMQASTAPIATTVNERPSQTTSASSPSQAEISQMLDYWYGKANEKTKTSFKTKINKE